MRAIARVLSTRLVSERIAIRVVQTACFAAGPAILLVSLQALSRMTPSRVEVLIGVLAAGATAVSLVTMGLVIGVMAERR